MSVARGVLKVFLVLLFSPCVLCLGGGAYVLLHGALREWRGIDMVTSRWMPMGPPRTHDSHKGFFVGEHAAFFSKSTGPLTSALWRVSAEGERLLCSFDGALLTLSGARGVWFGLVSKPAPPGWPEERLFQVIRSLDEGESWEERGWLLGGGTLLALSAREVWGFNGGLSVSTDGGETFSPVALPALPGFQPRHLVRGPEGSVWLLGPGGLWRLSEQGRTRSFEPLEGIETQAAEGGVLAAQVGNVLALRHDVPGETAWRPVTDLPHWVKEIAVVGDTVRVLTAARDPFVHGGDVWYHHSEDGGRTWVHVNTTLMTGRVTLHGARWGLGADLLGRVFGHVPGGAAHASAVR